MTETELDLVNNVAQKLEIYMTINKQTIFSLAKAMNIDRQPFYRILNRKNVPTISSLFTIASNLNCSIQELISQHVFIDIPVYENFINKNIVTDCRIYISYDDYLYIKSYELYGIKISQELKTYYKVSNFINDGLYIVSYNSKTLEMEILSAGSKFIIACIEGKEQRVDSNQVVPIAKYYKSVPLVTDSYSIQIPFCQ